MINQYYTKYGSGLPTQKLLFPPFTTIPNHRMLNSTEYASRIGALSYLAHRTRPDIAAVTNFLARRQHCFTISDCYALTRVFDFLKYHALFIDKLSPLELTSYVDADWGGVMI